MKSSKFAYFADRIPIWKSYFSGKYIPKGGPKAMLLEHNYPVYQALEDMLAENNKAILVTATGTGKSYVA